MTALSAIKALYFSTLYLFLSESSTVQRDIVDGQTDEPILFYQYATLAAQTFMYAVCGLSWSMFTLMSLFTNPWWFLGTQFVNLSLYYYAVYKPYAASDLSTKNPQINSLTFEPFSNETLQEKKNQAQTRFVFGFFGLLGIDSFFLFKSFRDFLHHRLHNVNTETDPVLSGLLDGIDGLLDGIDDMDAVLTREEIIKIQQYSQSIGIPERVFLNALDVDVLTKGTDIANALSQYWREQHGDSYWTLSTQVKRLRQLPNLLMQLPRQIWNNARKLRNFQYLKRCALDLLWRCGRFALYPFIDVMVRVINVFDLLSTLIEYIELGPLVSFSLKHATSLTMHATIGLHLYWYAPLLMHSAPAAITLSIGILSLLNYHRLLAPGAVSTLNDMTQTSRFFRPFIIGDLFIKLHAIFKAVTICSRSAGKRCLQFIAFLIRQDPLYATPKYLFKKMGVMLITSINLCKEICSQIGKGTFSLESFKKAYSDISAMIDSIPLDEFQQFVTQGIAYLDTYSRMFTDWSVKRRLLDAPVPFKFKEQSLDQAAWVSRWKQYLDQYLSMQTVLLYSDTDMHCKKIVDNLGNESDPLTSDAPFRKMIGSAQSNQFHGYYQKMQDGRYVLVCDALRWNRAAAQPKQQGFFRSFWQRLMGLLSSNSDMDTLFAFFVDNLSDEIQKIPNNGNCGWVYNALSQVTGDMPAPVDTSSAEWFKSWYAENCVDCSDSEQRSNKNRLAVSLKSGFNQELKRINDSGNKGDEVHQLLTQFGESIAKLIREYAQFSSSNATGQQLKKRVLDAFRENILPNISVCPDGAVGGLKEGQIELDQASTELDGTTSWLNTHYRAARVNAESNLSQAVAVEIGTPMRFLNPEIMNTMGNSIAGEMPNSSLSVYATDIPDVYESRSIVGPGHAFGPVYALSLASTPSASSQGLDVNNRHKNNIARAWCGLNTDIDELSMLERSELGHGQIFCPAVNYQALRDTLPIGHHFKNCLVEGADDQIIPLEYFERRGNSQSHFYTDWISYLCKEGYLNTDIASDQLSPDQMAQRAAALYELVSQQLDLSNSLLYKFALYDQLVIEEIDVNRLNWDQLVALANNDQGFLGGELFSHIDNWEQWHQKLINDTNDQMAGKLHHYLECPLTQFRVMSNLLDALVNRSPNRSQIEIDKACKHLHHLIILPSVLTLLLDQGILYRGAGTDDINIDAIYPTLESLSQETLADHSTTAHPTKRSWFGFVRDWAASLVAGLRMTPYVLYVLTSIIIKQTLITSKGLAVGAIHFALSLPVTLFYSIPVGIYQYGYVGQIASAMLYAAKQAIYRLVVRPVYYAAYAMLTLCDWCVLKPIRFVAHAINVLVDWLFIAPARALFNRLFSLVVPGEKPQPSTSESLGGRPNTTRDATYKQANNATTLVSSFFRALTAPFNLTSGDSASLGSY